MSNHNHPVLLKRNTRAHTGELRQSSGQDGCNDEKDVFQSTRLPVKQCQYRGSAKPDANILCNQEVPYNCSRNRRVARMNII